MASQMLHGGLKKPWFSREGFCIRDDASITSDSMTGSHQANLKPDATNPQTIPVFDHSDYDLPIDAYFRIFCRVLTVRCWIAFCVWVYEGLLQKLL
jgi:hypothetical protein